MNKQLVQNFDMEGYVHGLGGVLIQSEKNEWELRCPTCGREKLIVNADKKTWHCWICEEYKVNWEGRKVPHKGAGGVIDLVQLMEGCSKFEALTRMEEGVVHNPLDALFAAGDIDAYEETPDRIVALDPPPHWQPIYGVLPYCQERGITEADVRQFGLVWCTAGRYRNRLVFPTWEAGQLVYWQARAMWKPHPGEKFIKSLNPPRVGDSLGPSDVLMNLDTAKHYDRVALVEGPTDCVHTGPSGVCSWGKKISVRQIMKLKRAGVRNIDLMWDGPTTEEPQGAWPEMMQAAARLSGIFDVNLVFLPWGDPGDYAREQLNGFRANAVPASSISKLAML